MDDRHVPMQDELSGNDVAPPSGASATPAGAAPAAGGPPTCEGIRSTGARFRAVAELLRRRGVSQCRLARLLVREIERHGASRYHPRTLRRQITGVVASVPADVERAMERVAAAELGGVSLDALLASEGLAVAPSELVVAHVPARTIKELADLWLHGNPGRSRRSLATAIIASWSGSGRAPDLNALQRLLAGRATRGRAEIEAALLRELAPQGAGTRADALGLVASQRAAIRQAQVARGLEDSRTFAELAWQWRLARREPSTRELALALRERLAGSGSPPSLEHLQRALDGRTPRVRRSLRAELEGLIRESDVPPPAASTVGAAPEDLAWVACAPIAAIAREWVAAHPGTTMRQLAIRVSRTAARMGYGKPHHAIQPILAGHKKKTRGFVLKALMRATNRGARIDPSHLLSPPRSLPRPASRREKAPPSGGGVLIDSLRRFPLLDRQTERELLLRYHRNRDPEAARLLVEGNLRFVAKLAHRYRSPGIDVNDLFAEGCTGLVEALDRYQPDRNVRFLTYAAHWIKKSIFEHLLSGSRVVPFRRGHAEASMFFAFRREQSRLRHGDVPADAESETHALAARFDTSEDRVRRFRSWLSRGDVALDASRSPYDERAAMTFLAAQEPSPEDDSSRQEQVAMVRRACRALDARARLIVARRLLVEPAERASLEELSRELGISRERVRQLQERAVEELRRQLAPVARLSA